MSTLIDSLFPSDDADSIRRLWEDKGSHLLLEQEIGKRLIESDVIIDELPLTQLMFIATLSPFASSKKECYDVAEIIYWGMQKSDILPLVTEHQGKALAYRCLISLGLFKPALIKRHRRHGSPSPDFYRAVGIESFSSVGMSDIGLHFGRWECFMNEFFV